MYHNGFVKVMIISPDVEVGNPKFNADKMLEVLGKKENQKAEFILFPELSMSGYSSADLFFQDYLLSSVEEEIQRVLDNNPFEGVVIFGAPIRDNNILFNCAVVIQKDKVLGIIPKEYLPHPGEFFETRWFVSGTTAKEQISSIKFLGKDVAFGKIIFNHDNVKFAVEVCADMFAPITPATFLYLHGADIVFNTSASPDHLGKTDLRRRLVTTVSGRNNGSYVYCSAGVKESSSEGVFSGHKMVTQNGEIIAEIEDFTTGDEILFADIDVSKTRHARRNNGWYKVSVDRYGRDKSFQLVPYNLSESGDYVFEKKLSKTPFIPDMQPLDILNRVYRLQGSAILKRLQYIDITKSVIGISGGLDSTLALLSLVEAYKHIGYNLKDIIAVTLPGLATSTRTLNNAKKLMELTGVTYKEINISDHVNEAFKLIGHDPNIKDVTYENTQARIRTEILMNLANEVNGIVIGTSDLSEVALGWATFNGDHMAMYGLNGGIPKTLVKFLVKTYALKYPQLKDVLEDIVGTPISPELTDNDQNTESIIGKYEINDFIMHRFLVCGDKEDRIIMLLNKTFDLSKEEASSYTTNFYNRFFSQQYKRSTMPDAPKIVTLSLSSRGSYKMVGDMKYIK